MYRALLFFALFFLMGTGYGQSVDHKDGTKPNALVNESSPYLLQHAYNPVDWIPWGEEAFQRAKKENKLVVISIGYSSCHWCQVMEEESFENKEVASSMNKNYISIKVDREEHPDVDQFYINFLGLIGSDQGWPINIIALPDGKPFYGGTYHTKEKWLDILAKIATIHDQNPSKLGEYANKITLAMEELNRFEKSDDKSITKEILLDGIENWKKNWDSKFGGDLAIEKRMYPSNLIFLMEYGVIAKDSGALGHVKNTLDHIAKRGLYDHVEGGFFRYTTDSDWKTPHFEKMLYDNAQALGLFSYAYKVFKDPRYKQIVSETFHFLKNEMRSSNGAFISSINADIDGEEGKFYLWTLDELEQAVPEQFDLFSDFYDFTEMEGSSNRNILLTVSQNEEGFGERHSLGSDEVHHLTQLWRSQLVHAKAKKTRPSVDNKILISWNALLATGLLDAYKAFGNPEYLEVAKEVMVFIASKGFKNGELIHSYTDQGSHIGGFIEDYAYVIKASLEFYGVTFDESYLKMATRLTQKVLNEYSDGASSMFKYNSSDKLIIKVIKTNDGVLPSPNAVMANNLFSLGNIYYETDFLDRSQKMLQGMVESFHTYPEHYAKWGSLFLKNVYPFFEVAVVGPRAMELVEKMFALKEQNMLLVGTETKSDLPLFEDRYVDNDTYIYVCQNGSCKLPVTTLKAALQQLNAQ